MKTFYNDSCSRILKWERGIYLVELDGTTLEEDSSRRKIHIIIDSEEEFDKLRKSFFTWKKDKSPPEICSRTVLGELQMVSGFYNFSIPNSSREKQDAGYHCDPL